MSGRKLDNATYNVDTDWQDETESKAILKYGHYGLKFSEMTTTSAPIIQAGSSIDIDGVVYIFDSNYTPAGTPSSGTNYIRVYDSTSIAIAQHTTIAPATYDYIKKGYYDATGTYRYVLVYTSTGSDFSDKRIMNKGEALYLENDITFGGDITVEGTLGSPTLNTGQGDNELYEMNQNVKSTDSPTFNVLNAGTVNTGNGATEIYDMNQDVRSDDSVAFVGVTLSGAFTPRSNSTTGSYIIPANGVLVIPRGIYTFNNNGGVYSDYLGLSVYTGSAWTNIYSVFGGGAIISDGVNVRLRNTNSTYTVTVYYRKF